MKISNKGRVERITHSPEIQWLEYWGYCKKVGIHLNLIYRKRKEIEVVIIPIS
jgi:hypothetical protein